MCWTITYRDEAKKDLKKLDNSKRTKVLAAIKRVSENPLPKTEGGYGKPLGNKNGNDLTGLMKIKLRDDNIRVVYQIVKTEKTMEIIVIALREDNEVYEIAAKRFVK